MMWTEIYIYKLQHDVNLIFVLYNSEKINFVNMESLSKLFITGIRNDIINTQ